MSLLWISDHQLIFSPTVGIIDFKMACTLKSRRVVMSISRFQTLPIVSVIGKFVMMISNIWL